MSRQHRFKERDADLRNKKLRRKIQKRQAKIPVSQLKKIYFVANALAPTIFYRLVVALRNKQQSSVHGLNVSYSLFFSSYH